MLLVQFACVTLLIFLLNDALSQVQNETAPRNYSVLMVSLSNICRSPMAAAIFRDIVKKRNMNLQWHCTSAGTDTRKYAKAMMDPRAVTTLRKHGIEPTNHTVRPLLSTDYKEFDYIFAMDGANHADLMNRKRYCRGKSKAIIEMLGAYDPQGHNAIRYPYNDRVMEGFEQCFEIANRSCNAFLDKFSKLKR